MAAFDGRWLLSRNDRGHPKGREWARLPCVHLADERGDGLPASPAGHAPASEPFRKWVTEGVLPSIPKTGSYNINESVTKEGMQFAG